MNRPKKNGKILFVINGLGLGNSTRCAAVIYWLKEKGYSVDVLTSGNGSHYFKETQLIDKLFTLNSLDYEKNNRGDLSSVKTLLRSPKNFLILRNNARKLNSVMKNNYYQLLLTDSDYSLGLKFNTKNLPPVVSINNSSEVLNEFRSQGSAPFRLLPQLGIESLDTLYHRIIPDYLLIPGVITKELTKRKNTYFLPPLVRPGLFPKERKPSEVKNILIMLSASTFRTDISFIAAVVDKIKGINIHIIGQKINIDRPGCASYGSLMDNRDLINLADIMVVNGGASSLGEASALKKPVVVIPIKNHAEQYFNALQIEKNGLGIIADESNAGEKILELIENFDLYLARHHEFGVPSDGALKAGEIIESILEDKLVEKT